MSKLVGLVGWRGMVGSVLMDRMVEEKDFDLIEPVFFSTSNAGGKAPAMAKNEGTLQNAFDIQALKRCDIIVTAQGGDYTTEVFPRLRAEGWKGHWIDAASTLRMKDDAVIILDPVNMPVIKNALAKGGNNTWAPDVIRSGDKYFVYYSAPGTQPKAAIGLLVGKTLDPASPDYQWEDAGPVVWSDGVEDSNAIDPGVLRDPTTGRLWLTYG